MEASVKLNSSPVVGYKIALVNGADLSEEFKTISPAVLDDEGKVVREAVVVKQYERASIRQMRAIRKARRMKQQNGNVILFGARKDGTHFPVSLKTRSWR